MLVADRPKVFVEVQLFSHSGLQLLDPRRDIDPLR
jgi:hypothetical protein